MRSGKQYTNVPSILQVLSVLHCFSELALTHVSAKI